MKDAETLQKALIERIGSVLSAAPTPVEVLETHISRILLVGDRVYKFKRPITLPFVDYSSLSARQHFCAEELRLNSRLAPHLYLGVVQITGTAAAPELDGAGTLLEVAVCMRRFARNALWSERLQSGLLTEQHIDAFALRLAKFHHDALRAPVAENFGSPEQRFQDVSAAVRSLLGHVPELERASLEAWLEHRASALKPLWLQRQRAGYVRECHGDLHLQNLLVEGADAYAFDGIEFNPALRWIDIIDDVAFPLMDLQTHARGDLAFRLLDGWLESSGDHAGLPALQFSQVYRALVRAEVAMLQNNKAALLRYFNSALWLSQRSAARLLLTHGLPGSGKSYCAQRLLQATCAVRIRADVERKRLAGLAAAANSHAQGIDLYQEDVSARTYRELLRRAEPALAAGLPVILDAAYLRREQRAAAGALAAKLGVPFKILDCRAPTEQLRDRIVARRKSGTDPSEADLTVLEKLERSQQPLSAAERAATITVDSTVAFDAESVGKRWLEDTGIQPRS